MSQTRVSFPLFPSPSGLHVRIYMYLTLLLWCFNMYTSLSLFPLPLSLFLSLSRSLSLPLLSCSPPFPPSLSPYYLPSSLPFLFPFPPSLSLSLPAVTCPTDSRNRPDQRLLENGNVDEASSQKFRLEEKQRASRRVRESRKEQWKPRLERCIITGFSPKVYKLDIHIIPD